MLAPASPGAVFSDRQKTFLPLGRGYAFWLFRDWFAAEARPASSMIARTPLRAKLPPSAAVRAGS